MNRHGQIDVDVFLLANTEHPVGGLVLNSRVPPARQVDDVVGGGERQADAAGSW